MKSSGMKEAIIVKILFSSDLYAYRSEAIALSTVFRNLLHYVESVNRKSHVLALIKIHRRYNNYFEYFVERKEGRGMSECISQELILQQRLSRRVNAEMTSFMLERQCNLCTIIVSFR